MSDARIAYADLQDFVFSALKIAGLDEFSLEAVADGLCETTLRGVDSHGVRLLPHYVNSARSGRKNIKPDFKFTSAFPAFGHLDADNAFGHAAGVRAIDHAMEMADTMGLGAVSVANSSHCGAMACFALRAARKGFAAFAFTHADALLQSTNGQRPYFGTNPVCFAAPREGMEPYCLDAATSVIPWNRVLLHKGNGQELPKHTTADAHGNETTDPNAAAWLMPFGGYKGYGLSSMVEVLCGIMTGMTWGRHIPAMYKAPIEQPRRLGQFYLVMRTDAAMSADEFQHRMAGMSQEVAAEPALDPAQPVMLPGDREVLTAQNRLAEGVPLDSGTLAAFQKLADDLGIPLKTIV